jgi:hypothetical protein
MRPEHSPNGAQKTVIQARALSDVGSDGVDDHPPAGKRQRPGRGIQLSQRLRWNPKGQLMILRRFLARPQPGGRPSASTFGHR